MNVFVKIAPSYYLVVSCQSWAWPEDPVLTEGYGSSGQAQGWRGFALKDDGMLRSRMTGFCAQGWQGFVLKNDNPATV